MDLNHVVLGYLVAVAPVLAASFGPAAIFAEKDYSREQRVLMGMMSALGIFTIVLNADLIFEYYVHACCASLFGLVMWICAGISAHASHRTRRRLPPTHGDQTIH